MTTQILQAAIQITNGGLYTAMLAWASIFCLIATICLFLMKNFNKQRRIWMTCMLITCTFLLAADTLTYVFNGDTSSLGYYMVRISNALVFLLSDVIIFCFNGYICCNLFGDTSLKNKNKLLAARLVAVYVLAILGEILVIISQFTDLYYTINASNEYIKNDLFFISMLAPGIGLLIDLSIIIQYRKNVSKEILMPMLLNIILPLIAACIQISLGISSLINLSICVAVIVIFIFAIIDQSKVLNVKEKEASELKDSLKVAIDERERCYAAVAQRYYSMHLIDVKTGKYKAIKTVGDFEKYKDEQHGDDFTAQMRGAMEKLSTESFKKAVLYFTDVSTFEKRLDKKDILEHVFLGNVCGWCRESLIKVDSDEEGKPWHVLYCIEVIDKAKRKETHLQHLAETDIMTGLINRGTGEKRVKDLLSKNVYGMFCLIDCDKFKSINDVYGHSVGDTVIISLGKCLKKTCRDKDVVFRLGGDEFAVYLPGLVEKESAESFFNRFFDNLSKVEIPQLGGRKLSVSMGAELFSDGQMSFDTLYKNADTAMYESKKTTGCTATIYSVSSQQ